LLYSDLQVKENFERFISCKSTIDDIHVRLRKAEGDYGDSADGASTADMVAAVTDVSLFCKSAIYAYAVHQRLFESS
jgi:exocyst complex component 2